MKKNRSRLRQVIRKQILKIRQMKSNYIYKNIPDDWKEVKLNSISKKIGSGVTPRGGEGTYRKNGVRFLRSQNIQNGYLELNDVAYISSEVDEQMSNSRVYTGDILYN